MRFGKISAATMAAVMAATSTAIVCQAVEIKTVTPGEAPEWSADGKFLNLRLVTENEEKGLFGSATPEILEVAGVRYTVTGESKATGCVALNSPSTGWAQKDWTAKWDGNKGVLEYTQASPLFAESDKYAQVNLGIWSDITSVEEIDLLDKDGNVLWCLKKDGDAYTEGDAKYKGVWQGSAAASSDDLAAALENLSEEDKAKLEEMAAEIEANLSDEDKAKLEELADALGNMTDEEKAQLQEQVTSALDELGASLEAMLESIDPAEIEAIKAAAEELNSNITLGSKVDLLAALGMNWNKFTKVEADFSWTPGTGWCGGAGIGGGADVEGGSGWISGPEYGAANANAGVVDDGFATQTIIDLNGQHLASIASLNEDGTISFGEMQIQKWWNCDEANAKILAIRFLDDNGEVLAELVAPDAGRGDVIDESFAAPVETATAGDVAAATDSSKGSPDTGIADVAAIAGLAVVAGGAIVISKKRK